MGTLGVERATDGRSTKDLKKGARHGKGFSTLRSAAPRRLDQAVRLLSRLAHSPTRTPTMADDPTLRLLSPRLRNAIVRGNCKGVAAWLDDNKQHEKGMKNTMSTKVNICQLLCFAFATTRKSLWLQPKPNLWQRCQNSASFAVVHSITGSNMAALQGRMRTNDQIAVRA